MAVALKICDPPMHVIAAVCEDYFCAHGRLSHDKESMCLGDGNGATVVEYHLILSP